MDTFLTAWLDSSAASQRLETKTPPHIVRVSRRKLQSGGSGPPSPATGMRVFTRELKGKSAKLDKTNCNGGVGVRVRACVCVWCVCVCGVLCA